MTAGGYEAARALAGLIVACLFLLLPVAAFAQSFPPLTGRVVDAANLLQPGQRQSLEAKLMAYEDKTSDQVVVATVPSLGGTSVEDYANRLFRAWKLGQAKTDNGVLLLVAPTDRKVRIEVGYGLEGALTDALSKVIITTAIAPQFQKGNFFGGIDAGVDAILSILTGDAEQWQRRAQVREDTGDPAEMVFAFLFIAIIVFIMFRSALGNRGLAPVPGRSGGPWIGPMGGGFPGGFPRGGGFGGSGGRSGGFSGGGGSSGGGGASGSW
ncbi:TPM domain-containing protein [Microvirga pudoricolor]|uniref:TPM domain-containing protein n=1 Tax=Microvirga pudoricolor TaxID=2778729 RepID=UPI0019505534|nr:YgcG family protein [Microvirga pudoricolor]MBM6594057.1 YgcG family protein [Microvirga pudoricolor]